MFISLESTEGGGKGTLSRMACHAFRLSGTSFVHTRQPGGTPAGERCREILLWHDEKLTMDEEVMLLAVARKRCYEAIIRPALLSGKVVLCERWNATTVAYQGVGRNIGNDKGRVETIQFIYETFRRLGLTNIPPDISFLLAVNPERGLTRKTKQGKLDKFEKEALSFFNPIAEDLIRTHSAGPSWLMREGRILDSNVELIELAENFLGELADLGLVKSGVIAEAIDRGMEEDDHSNHRSN